MSTQPLLPTKEQTQSQPTAVEVDRLPVFPLPTTITGCLLVTARLVCLYCVLVCQNFWDITRHEAFGVVMIGLLFYLVACAGFPFEPCSNWRKGVDRDGRPWEKGWHKFLVLLGNCYSAPVFHSERPLFVCHLVLLGISRYSKGILSPKSASENSLPFLAFARLDRLRNLRVTCDCVPYQT